MAKILIVEDDNELAESVVAWLKLQNYAVDRVDCAEDGLQLLNSFPYDLVILDWQLPGMEGIEMCRQVRKKDGIPILFLTGKTGIDSVEMGLDAGADDYIQKPFQVRELGARIRSILRRPKDALPAVLSVEYLSLDLNSHTVSVDDQSVQLSPKEFAVLEFFMRHPNRFFLAKALIDHVWPSDAEISDETVRTVMKNLRRKITPSSKDCVIKNVQGSGYILNTNDGAR